MMPLRNISEIIKFRERKEFVGKLKRIYLEEGREKLFNKIPDKERTLMKAISNNVLQF